MSKQICPKIWLAFTMTTVEKISSSVLISDSEKHNCPNIVHVQHLGRRKCDYFRKFKKFTEINLQYWSFSTIKVKTYFKFPYLRSLELK